MRNYSSKNLVAERVGHGVRVIRFTRPDMWTALYDDADVEVMPLFHEIRKAAMDDLPKGGALVVNMSLVENFPAALYRCLLECRQLLLARPAKFVLCGLNDRNVELFRLLRGERVFAVAATEAEAIRAARQCLPSKTSATSTESLAATDSNSEDRAAPAFGMSGTTGSGAWPKRVIASMRRLSALRLAP